MRGVSVGARTVELVTVAKLLPLAIFVGVGMFFVHADAIRPTLPTSAHSVGAAVITLIFAFVGTEVALVPSGEFKDPARTVPRSIYLALGVVAFFYMAIQLVASGVLGPALAQGAATPLANASAVFLGEAGRNVMLAGAMISMAGYLSGDVLSSPRLLYAFGRDGLLPPVLAKVHDRYRTPANAIVAHAAICAALTILGTFGKLLLMANVAVLSMYFLCCAAAWQLARRDVRTDGEPFVPPGGPLIPVLACAAVAWVLSNATLEEFEIEGAVIVAATMVFALHRLRRKTRTAMAGS